jgi:hypothetical protein
MHFWKRPPARSVHDESAEAALLVGSAHRALIRHIDR